MQPLLCDFPLQLAGQSHLASMEGRGQLCLLEILTQAELSVVSFCTSFKMLDVGDPRYPKLGAGHCSCVSITSLNLPPEVQLFLTY